jgi:hypothetical protein
MPVSYLHGFHAPNTIFWREIFRKQKEGKARGLYIDIYRAKVIIIIEIIIIVVIIITIRG